MKQQCGVSGGAGGRQGADRWGGAETQTADNSGIEKDGKTRRKRAIEKTRGARGEKCWRERGEKTPGRREEKKRRELPPGRKERFERSAEQRADPIV